LVKYSTKNAIVIKNKDKPNRLQAAAAYLAAELKGLKLTYAYILERVEALWPSVVAEITFADVSTEIGFLTTKLAAKYEDKRFLKIKTLDQLPEFIKHKARPKWEHYLPCNLNVY
jgi:hypothetical protein